MNDKKKYKTVDKMINEILEHEGGFVNHPADRGGPTNFGITIKTFSNWLTRPASISEVQNMDIETAKEIYETKYFTEPRINTLFLYIQPLVFDCSINHGPKRAIKFLQQVVNLSGFGPLATDGLLGPKTRESVKKAFLKMKAYFINAVVDERIIFYNQIVNNDHSQKLFLTGWINRAEKFRSLSCGVHSK